MDKHEYWALTETHISISLAVFLSVVSLAALLNRLKLNLCLQNSTEYELLSQISVLALPESSL